MGKGEPGKSLKEAQGKSGAGLLEVWGRHCKSFVKANGKGLGKRTFGEEKSWAKLERNERGVFKRAWWRLEKALMGGPRKPGEPSGKKGLGEGEASEKLDRDLGEAWRSPCADSRKTLETLWGTLGKRTGGGQAWGNSKRSGRSLKETKKERLGGGLKKPKRHLGRRPKRRLGEAKETPRKHLEKGEGLGKTWGKPGKGLQEVKEKVGRKVGGGLKKSKGRPAEAWGIQRKERLGERHGRKLSPFS